MQINDFPREILVEIFKELEPRNRLNLLRTCQLWNLLIPNSFPNNKYLTNYKNALDNYRFSYDLIKEANDCYNANTVAIKKLIQKIDEVPLKEKFSLYNEADILQRRNGKIDEFKRKEEKNLKLLLTKLESTGYTLASVIFNEK